MNTVQPEVLGALKARLDSDRIATDEASRVFHSQDVYRRGDKPLAVVSPQNVEEVSAAVIAATESGCAVFVRGGGMSYTDAFIPNRGQSIILDMSRLNEIRAINAQDLYATVDAGCTWAQLDEALADKNLRAIFWGPMSGSVATVGGAMSQGAATFGSGRHGVSASAALGFEVVTADGSVIKTGSDGQPHHDPFFRHYGPDLTGLFTGDAGALGVKTAVTLQLEPRPAYGDGLSFGFDDFAGLAKAVGQVMAQGVATEVFGAETALAKQVADASTFTGDLKALMGVARSADNPLTGLKRAIQIAANGRRFLDQSTYSVSFLAEGHTRAELRDQLRRIRTAVGEDGYEIANTMALVTRATPFPAPMVLGPGGRRLLPLNAIVPHSAALGLHSAVQEYLKGMESQCRESGIEIYLVYSATGRSGFLYELVLYWPDEWDELHRQTVPKEILAVMSEGSSQPAVRDLVDQLKTELVDIMYRNGGVHLQIGRLYPYAREREENALSLLRQIKRQVDPKGLINPGSLGI